MTVTVQALVASDQVKTNTHPGVTTHWIIFRGIWSEVAECCCLGWFFVYRIFAQLMRGRNIRPLMNYYYPTMFIQWWNKDILLH